MKSFKDRIAAKKSRLNQSTAAVATAVALTSISQQAEAALVEWNFDLAGSKVVDPLTGDQGFAVDNPLSFASTVGLYITTGAPNVELDQRGFLSPGMTVGLGFGSFSGSNLFSTAPDGEELLFGFRLLNQGVSGTETYYGWGSVTPIAPTGFNSLLNKTVLNTTDGEAITVIPEPSVSLFGAAALVMTFSMRRRKGARR